MSHVKTDVPYNFPDLSHVQELPTEDMQAQFWMQMVIAWFMQDRYRRVQLSESERDDIKALIVTGHVRSAVEKYLETRRTAMSTDEFLVWHFTNYFKESQDRLVLTQSETEALCKKCKEGKVFEAVKDFMKIRNEDPDDRFAKILAEYS